MKNKTYNKKKILVVFLCAVVIILGLIGRLVYLMVFDAEYYQELAEDLHEREREIKAARGEIVDRNGVVLATNKTVCTISVVHSQIEDPELVTEVLASELGLEQGAVRKKVEKVSSMEKIKTNVEKETGDRIRNYDLAGVKVDEDYRRYYPYDELASKVLGFTGGDNQGIIGLEVKYEDYLKGTNGTILTTTDARGIELDGVAEDRIEPAAGETLQVTLDYNIQAYCEQAALKVMEEKQADSVSILLMNPQNGEIYAMVNVPEFNLNEPYELNTGVDGETLSDEDLQDQLNQMWRNGCINDTYEPDSTFKIITSSACLEEGVVSLDDTFMCPGYRIVEDRKIRCHKTGGHGGETFLQGMMNSCNPVLIDVGQRLGVENYCRYFDQFGLRGKTGIDIPGEAATIMHDPKNMGPVELATVSFGQSFQITPVQLVATVSSIINGGRRVTPHFALEAQSRDKTWTKKFSWPLGEQILSEETSETMRYILEMVVAEGSGKNAAVKGYRIGGKTATSEKLPRSLKKYISSFIGFAPADDPQVIALITIDEPEGIYYGGTIAAPVIGDLFRNILLILGIQETQI